MYEHQNEEINKWIKIQNFIYEIELCDLKENCQVSKWTKFKN